MPILQAFSKSAATSGLAGSPLDKQYVQLLRTTFCVEWVGEGADSINDFLDFCLTFYNL